MNDKVAVAYVPVLHAGYRKFFDLAVSEGATALYLVGDDILAAHDEFDYIRRKDQAIRGVSAPEMQKALLAILSIPVYILTPENAGEIKGQVLMPAEDISELLAQKYFNNANALPRTPFFLRWNRDNTAENDHVAEAHRAIDVSDTDREFMGQAFEAAEGSADWWRQVGCVIAKNGEIILAGFNKHMPDEQSPYVNGDPRSVYKRGVAINLSTALHGEGGLIAEAARKGIPLEGASIYVTDFPCPFCARMIAHSGIKKCYFAKGYAALDGEDILKAAGVELVFVDMKKEQE